MKDVNAPFDSRKKKKKKKKKVENCFAVPPLIEEASKKRGWNPLRVEPPSLVFVSRALALQGVRRFRDRVLERDARAGKRRRWRIGRRFGGNCSGDDDSDDGSASSNLDR